jgi:hypothetical protein
MSPMLVMPLTGEDGLPWASIRVPGLSGRKV